jgi:hypothetical protein
MVELERLQDRNIPHRHRRRSLHFELMALADLCGDRDLGLLSCAIPVLEEQVLAASA